MALAESRSRQSGSPQRRRRRRWLLPLLVGTAVGVGAWLMRQPILVFEESGVDLLQELAGPRRPPPGIVIVGIDDYSLAQAANADLSGDPDLARLGEWPWPRAVYATLLERLRQAGARAVAFDLMFETPSSHGAGDDRAFARALGAFGRPVVLGAMVLEPRTSQGVSGLSLARPLPMLATAGPLVREGLLNGPVDPDGAIRQPPSAYGAGLRETTDLELPPSLATVLKRGPAAAEPAASGRWRSGRGLGLLRFYGPPATFPTLPIWSLLEPVSFRSVLTQGTLRDAVVLVGPTAATLQDIHVTPFSGSEGMAGVEIHATELANLRQGIGLELLRPTPAWAALVGLWTALLLLLLQRQRRPLVRFGIAAAVVLLLLGAVVIAAETSGFLLLPLTLVGVSLGGGLLSAGEAAARNEIDRRRLRATLGKYLSPAVADELTRDPDTWEVQVGGRAVDVVVLMIDIRGFTTKTTAHTESGQVPQLVDQLNEYFSVVVSDLMAEGATVDKFIGDAVLAYFGAPISRGPEEDARAAVRAVRRIAASLDALNERWEPRGLEPWQVVVVLSAGTVICGNIGSPQRLDYTIIGDAVNRAARLEYVAKETGHVCVCTEAVVERAGLEKEAEHLGRFPIRGQGELPVYGLPLPERRSSAKVAT
jgi:adenylate cyclase